MKTAGRENPNHGVAWPRNRAHGAVAQNRSRSLKWAAKQEKFQPKERSFFLTSTFIERSGDSAVDERVLGTNPTDDPITVVNRAKAFYREAHGLPLISEDEFALVFDALGTMLRVTRVRELAAAKYTALGWHVRDIIQTAKD